MTVSRGQAATAWMLLGRPEVDVEGLRVGIEIERMRGLELLDAAEIAVARLLRSPDAYAGSRMARMTPNAASAQAAFSDLLWVFETQFPDFGTLTLIADDRAHDGGRHYAYCGKTRDGAEIAFASAADDHLEPEQMRAMMAHEMGHAIDFRYDVRALEQRFRTSLSSDIERRADQIAEAVFLFPIRYDAKCAYVQTTGRGVYPRPRGLR